MRGFTNLDEGEQRAVLYEKVSSIEEHLKKQNNKIDTNCKSILIGKVIGTVLFVILCILVGVGVPFIPLL